MCSDSSENPEEPEHWALTRRASRQASTAPPSTTAMGWGMGSLKQADHMQTKKYPGRGPYAPSCKTRRRCGQNKSLIHRPRLTFSLAQSRQAQLAPRRASHVYSTYQKKNRAASRYYTGSPKAPILTRKRARWRPPYVIFGSLGGSAGRPSGPSSEHRPRAIRFSTTTTHSRARRSGPCPPASFRVAARTGPPAWGVRRVTICVLQSPGWHVAVCLPKQPGPAGPDEACQDVTELRMSSTPESSFPKPPRVQVLDLTFLASHTIGQASAAPHRVSAGRGPRAGPVPERGDRGASLSDPPFEHRGPGLSRLRIVARSCPGELGAVPPRHREQVLCRRHRGCLWQCARRAGAALGSYRNQVVGGRQGSGSAGGTALPGGCRRGSAVGPRPFPPPARQLLHGACQVVVAVPFRRGSLQVPPVLPSGVCVTSGSVVQQTDCPRSGAGPPARSQERVQARHRADPQRPSRRRWPGLFSRRASASPPAPVAVGLAAVWQSPVAPSCPGRVSSLPRRSPLPLSVAGGSLVASTPYF